MVHISCIFFAVKFCLDKVPQLAQYFLHLHDLMRHMITRHIDA